MQLSIGSTLEFSPDIQVKLNDLYEFELYDGQTLQDILEQIDLAPDNFETIDVEDILVEIDYEDSYEDILGTEMYSKSRNFVSEFLKGVNKEYLGEYDGEINGESPFYDLVYFEGNDNENSLEKLQEIYELTGSEVVKKIIDDKWWETKEDVCYVFYFVTEVKE